MHLSDSDLLLIGLVSAIILSVLWLRHRGHQERCEKEDMIDFLNNVEDLGFQRSYSSTLLLDDIQDHYRTLGMFVHSLRMQEGVSVTYEVIEETDRCPDLVTLTVKKIRED